MEALISIPANVEVKTVKAVVKALGVSSFRLAAENGAAKKKKADRPYNPEYVAKILQGQQDLKDGKGIRVTLDEIWK